MTTKEQIDYLNQSAGKRLALKRCEEAIGILTKLEEQEKMPQEEILRLAKKIRPLVRVGKTTSVFQNQIKPLFWAEAPHIATKSFTFNSGRGIKIATGIHEIARITTYHRYGGFRVFLRPSVDEAIIQCPKELLDKVVGFEFQTDTLKASAVYDRFLDRHVLRTVYYTGELPEDIANLPVEW